MNRQLEYLIADGTYRRARFFDKNDMGPDAIKDLDTIRVFDPDGKANDYCATSVRITLIGREKAGGPLGERWGIICATNDRKKTRYTLGGGRVEPSVNLNRVGDEAPEESVLSCLVREVEEELKINIDPERLLEKIGRIPDGLILIGLRMVTEDNSDEPKKLNGRTCVDACFLMIIEERLGYSDGFRGETGIRLVLSPQDLFARAPQGELKTLPQPQMLALAMAIIFAEEVFADAERHESLRQIIADGLGGAQRVRENSQWTKYFIPTLQF